MCEIKFRGSLQLVLYQKVILKNFAKFTEKPLRWSLLLIKLQVYILVHSCFAVHFVIFFFNAEHLRATTSVKCRCYLILGIKRNFPSKSNCFFYPLFNVCCLVQFQKNLTQRFRGKFEKVD